MTTGEFIFLYGPSGSGKSTTGRLLAARLDLPFYDLDEAIEARSGSRIEAIFEAEGEEGFRQRETAELKQVLVKNKGVVALGGGALTTPENRQTAEASGQVLLLTARHEILAKRLQTALDESMVESDSQSEGLALPVRPLLSGDLPTRLHEMLQRRSAHYASFPLQLDTGALSPAEAAWQAQICLGLFRVSGMGAAYDVRAISGGLESLGSALQRLNLHGPLALVSDENVASHYAQPAVDSLKQAGYTVNSVVIPSGEINKTVQTVHTLWDAFLQAGVERTSTVIALGGGVVGDLTGFAAATYLRGVKWVNVPTTLLSMVDASLGGKTGADLPQGKNLVGAFHPPALVLADPHTLSSLPAAELRSGMAEVLKHGIISDPVLFDMASRAHTDSQELTQIVQRGMAVKVEVIEEDPYERGRRAALNLGHTVGHAVEFTSGFALRHGEAVAIGMVVEAQLAELLEIAERGLAESIASALDEIGLPTSIPKNMDRKAIIQAIGVDKKKAAGKARFALPVRIGEVVTGIEVTEFEWLEAL